MKVKGKLISTLLVGTVVAALSTSVHAYSVGLNLSSSSKLVAGDSVTVNVNTGAIDADPGIDGLEAKLDYDSDVFETVGQSDIVASAGWVVSYESSTGFITLYRPDGSRVSESQVLLTINLKAKDSISANSSTIKLVGSNSPAIIVSGGEDQSGYADHADIEVASASVTVYKDEDSQSETGDVVTPTPAQTPEADNGSSAGTTSGGSSSSSSVPATLKVSSGDSTKAGTKLPQTGENDVAIYSIAGISILAVLSLGGYLKYRKDMK